MRKHINNVISDNDLREGDWGNRELWKQKTVHPYWETERDEEERKQNKRKRKCANKDRPRNNNKLGYEIEIYTIFGLCCNVQNFLLKNFYDKNIFPKHRLALAQF